MICFLHKILKHIVVVMMNALLLQVERLETRVVSPLKAYGDVVKSKRVSSDTDLCFWYWYICKRLILADYHIGLKMTLIMRWNTQQFHLFLQPLLSFISWGQLHVHYRTLTGLFSWFVSWQSIKKWCRDSSNPISMWLHSHSLVTFFYSKNVLNRWLWLW